MNVLLKSVTVVDANNTALHLKKRDILIRNGHIDKIAQKIDASSKVNVITHQNLHVSLGWLDTGVSFGEPGYEERETIANGLLTAAKSGFTDVFLNANNNPLPDTSSDIVYLKNAASGQLTNLYPLGCLTVGSAGESLAEIYDMHKTGAIGFYDFKSSIANANLLKIALQYAQDFEGMVFSFALNRNIAGKGIVNEGAISTTLGLKGIPALAEEIQVARDLLILEYTGGKLHFPTISTAESVALIAQAKKKGLPVTCSVPIHNLVFTDQELLEYDTRYKVMPPLRTAADQKELIKGLQNGTIDFVTSDHIPLNKECKHVEFDNAEYGSIGLETMFGSLNKLFGMEKAIALLTHGRDIFGLPTMAIAEGSTACLTLFDPSMEYSFEDDNIYSTSHNSMFIGSTLKGVVLGSINNNKIIFNP